MIPSQIRPYLEAGYLPQRYRDKFLPWLSMMEAGTISAKDGPTLLDEFVNTSATFGVKFSKKDLPNLVPVEIQTVSTGPAIDVPAGWVQAGPGRWTAPTVQPLNPSISVSAPPANFDTVTTTIQSPGDQSAAWISPPPPTQPAPAPIVAPTPAPPAPAVPTPKPAQPAPQAVAPTVAPRMATQTEPDMAIAQTPNGQTFQVAPPSPGGGPTAQMGIGSILAGAAAGFLSGGPVGALVGGALGAAGGGTAQVGSGPVISTMPPQYPQYPTAGPAMPGLGPMGQTPGISGQQTAGWGNPIDRQLAEILAGGLPGPLGMGAQWGIDQFYGDTSLPQPSVVQAGSGAAIVEPLAKTINKAPAGYVLVTRDWLNNGTQTTLAVRKDMARCYGYKKPAKPPISVGDWNALKKANRTVKKVQRIDKMAANLTKCSTRRRTR